MCKWKANFPLEISVWGRPTNPIKDGEFHLISATAAFMKRDLKRIVGFCEVVIPCYAIDEFRSYFRMANSCTLENSTVSSSHVDASHVTQLKIGVWLVLVSNGIRSDIFRLGVLWTTFQDVPFILQNFRSGKPKQSDHLHLHPNRNFRNFSVNGKHTVRHIGIADDFRKLLGSDTRS